MSVRSYPAFLFQISTANYTCFFQFGYTLGSRSIPPTRLTTSCRVCACNFSIMFRRCTFTVFSAMSKMGAISLLVKPCFTKDSTACSRLLRRMINFPASLPSSKKLNSASSLAAIGGDTMNPPSATRMMALMRFSRLASLDKYALAPALIAGETIFRNW